ncbi:MAG TPA: DNA mismatch repair endonuclease MutL [Thermoanaerobaculia bacterium]|nr:DNA mismatch repair endonuclease MutL [Thermoanaerobaculia bacterium]
MTTLDHRPQTRSVQVLPGELINQIAAGEVVERPASVVKELVENAIDAGATQIDVLLENGGKKLIEVSDNGCGMSPVDALSAMQRHATSKIARFEDLLTVSTLGFRGEAIPSIASVSRFSLLTFDGMSAHATEIEHEPGAAPRSSPAARSRGTTVRVADLFENVPARKKFLKSSDAEFRSIISIITSYALPGPSRSFRLIHNGRTVLDLPAAATPRERAIQILGDEVIPNLEEVSWITDRCSVHGFVTRGLRFGSRRNQFFFVNGRLVRDKVLTHATNRATDAFDNDGHPAVVLFLDIDPAIVDVNVHPAKTEVRFRDSGQIHVAVEQAIKRAMAGPEEGSGLLRIPDAPLQQSIGDVPGPNLMHQDENIGQSSVSDASSFFPVPAARGDYQPRFEVTPLFQQKALVQPPREAFEPVMLGDLRGRVIGQYRDSYILIDTPEGLRLVDQHVAHERVLYDRIAASARDTISVQTLLTPVIYETGIAEGGILESHLGELREVGFDIEPFSGRSFAVKAVPTILRRDGIERFFRKLVDASMADKQSHVARLREKMIATLACHAAIKVHRPLSGPEMSQVVGDLLASSNPFACPHGRPIIVDIRHLDIEKHFHRK